MNIFKAFLPVFEIVYRIKNTKKPKSLVQPTDHVRLIFSHIKI